MRAGKTTIVATTTLLAGGALASGGAAAETSPLSFIHHPVAWVAMAVFVMAYVVVVLEEKLHIRKSKPVMLAAGTMWMITAALFIANGDLVSAEHKVKHNILEFGELFLFLLSAMTFINTLEERGLFDVVRSWLVRRKFGRRGVFWTTGAFAFVLSPIADNLTTALVMGAVLLSVARKDPKFVGMGCINVVVAANAGGAFSPFGDITTLMVWQRGVVTFSEFFALVIPSLITWLIPAVIMTWWVKPGMPEGAREEEQVMLKKGAKTATVLFLFTVALAVSCHSVLHLPPVVGMMTGLGVLQIFGFTLRRRDKRIEVDRPFDIFDRLARAEWDTLLFFYGVILCVGALSALGYLPAVARFAYAPGADPTWANVAVGVLSAIVDNIPVMFAVLEMNPTMSVGQWLLVTLTAGVGGSLLAVGSAAGVALLGQARGFYTFFLHMKFTPWIALGYAAGIAAHFLVNGRLFEIAAHGG